MFLPEHDAYYLPRVNLTRFSPKSKLVHLFNLRSGHKRSLLQMNLSRTSIKSTSSDLVLHFNLHDSRSDPKLKPTTGEIDLKSTSCDIVLNLNYRA